MSMVSSRNVQEVILFLKKELVKTHDQDYDKVDIHSTLSMREFSILTQMIEYRVSSTFGPIDPHLRGAIFRGCIQCRPRIDGILGRFQQPLGSRRCQLCSRSHGEAS